jgi:uncharacterized membrane-anchored protein
VNLLFDFAGAAPNSGRRTWIAAITLALLQTAILLFLVISHATILRNGAEVLLKAAPVDPRDLLRGDYITLNYDISHVPVTTLVGARPTTDGERTLSVRLQGQANGYWGIAESSFDRLPAKADTVVLQTRPFDYRPSADVTTIGVDYGIESFYVPEGEGHHLEQAPADGALAVAVRISASGTAQIKTLLLDGKPVYDEPLY